VDLVVRERQPVDVTDAVAIGDKKRLRASGANCGVMCFAPSKTRSVRTVPDSTSIVASRIGA
jgi:hypothetical protein